MINLRIKEIWKAGFFSLSKIIETFDIDIAYITRKEKETRCQKPTKKIIIEEQKHLATNITNCG